MTDDFKGLLRDVREVLQMYCQFNQNVTDENKPVTQLRQTLTRLDAFMAAVPDGLEEALEMVNQLLKDHTNNPNSHTDILWGSTSANLTKTNLQTIRKALLSQAMQEVEGDT